jgi:hypothetical protein
MLSSFCWPTNALQTKSNNPSFFHQPAYSLSRFLNPTTMTANHHHHMTKTPFSVFSQLSVPIGIINSYMTLKTIE